MTWSSGLSPDPTARPGLYLHIPFCRRKCPYCDFYSRADRAELIPDYHLLLTRQLKLFVAEGWDQPFETVFFGGGTPSLLSAKQVATVLEAAATEPGLTADAEISLEVNPGTIEASGLSELCRAGVNRLSIGVQSFDDARLRQLGRLHDAGGAVGTVEQARRAGFDNISIDLMFALPNQTVEELENDLGSALSLETEHLSIYGYSLEEGSAWAGRPDRAPVDEETYARMYETLHERLDQAGFRHYEISNFARPGRECRHNLGYWHRRPCLGLGAGAHGFQASGWGRRFWTPPDLDRFATALERGENPAADLECFDREGAMREYVYLALRTADGVDEAEFSRRFGIAFEEFFSGPLQTLSGQMGHEAGRWFLPWKSWLVYDRLVAQFL